MLVVGIDPGLEGGLAYIHSTKNGFQAEAIKLPFLGKRPDVPTLREFFKEAMPQLICIEKLNNRPGQSAQSGMTSGTNHGIILGVIECLDLPYRIIDSRLWKKHILKGTPKDKEAAIAFTRRAYPTINLKPGKCTTPQDGIADAVCIAEYARLVQQGVL